MSEPCGCVYVDSSYDSPSFFCEKNPVAHQAHRCTECNRLIQPGEQYRKESGVWDGVFETHKICPDCLSVRDTFFCEGWFYEQIWEDLENHIRDMAGQIPEDCILGLTENAKAHVLSIIDELWEDYEE